MERILAAALSGFLMIAVSSAAFADKITPENPCKPPRHYFKFKSQSEADKFKKQVDDYKKCISDFVEEQNREIEKHRDAANNAITEYNFFIKTEFGQ